MIICYSCNRKLRHLSYHLPVNETWYLQSLCSWECRILLELALLFSLFLLLMEDIISVYLINKNIEV